MGDKKQKVEKRLVSQIKNQKIVEEKRKLIVHAAGELFSLKGYHKTTLRDIAKASGIHLSYLYKYISSKDDIFYLYYRYLIQEINAWYKPYLKEDGTIDRKLSDHAGPVQVLKAIIQNVLEGIYRMNDEMLTLLTEARHLNDDSLKAILAEESSSIAEIERVIKIGVAEGYFETPDTTLAANVVSHLLLIYPLRGWNFKKNFTFKRFVDLMTQLIFSALNVKEDPG